MNAKYLEAIKALSEIIVEQNNELKYRQHEVEHLRKKIKDIEAFCDAQKVSNSKEIK